MIEAKDLCLRYADGTLALKDININIGTGEVVFVIGPSGSGKTSFLKLLLGMEHPTSGYLSVLGHSITKDKSSQIRKMRMAMGPIFQDFRLLQGRTVMENVLLGMRFLDFNKQQMLQDARETIQRVGLNHKINSSVDNLSWGERQRVAIARAVARKPKLIIADEPTGNLDKDNAINILELLTSFKDNDTTVIITTHATHLIENIEGDMLIQIDKGNIQWGRLSHEEHF
ncbi:cell division transport system ATP-binding protein [Proteiniborus sp. DW1]|uniref:cell division ATP-binding protein FtsE n=1 Tax=Proteiniborus sp. DW1 TaxID=1889883 RepID=UPI00092E0946|nr:ATP-binding cassette domain-containing protein [Proteiniborus sp. DW1]SCG82911.1 cell division transport system ATP-binding protein [Proteiniborus sp. DW1]